MTAIITVRAFKNSASHLFLEQSCRNFENNADRIVRRLHKHYGLTAVPSPIVHDAVAKMSRDDDCLAAQLFGGVIHEAFEADLASAIAGEFSALRGDITPGKKQLAGKVGPALARDAEPLLSLAEKLAIVRSMSKESAVALCEKKIASERARFEDSICSPGVGY